MCAALRQPFDRGRPLVEFLGGEPFDGSVLVASCDIVIPASMEGTLNGDVAARLSARLVVEGANGPTALAAETILTGRNIAVVPDVIAKAGGAISFYFEWVQNHQRMPPPETDERNRVLERLDATWRLIAMVPAEEWRNRALTSTIRRVIHGMAAGGILLPGTVGAAPDGGGAR